MKIPFYTQSNPWDYYYDCPSTDTVEHRIGFRLRLPTWVYNFTRMCHIFIGISWTTYHNEVK